MKHDDFRNSYRKDPQSYWNGLHGKHEGMTSAVGYSGLGEGFNGQAYLRLRIPSVRRLLKRQSVFPARLLEAGVGAGVYAPLWEELSASEWVGVDISPVAIKDLQQRFPQSAFFVIDLTKSNPELSEKLGENFCLVTAIDVLYHIVDDDAFAIALQLLADKVRPGGRLLISDVFTDSPLGRSCAHVRRRPIAQYQKLLAQKGFDLIDREPVFAILADPVPQSGFHPVQMLLFETWRVIQKLLRILPSSLQNVAGDWLVRLLAPLDELIRRTGATEGVNLELVMFRRSPADMNGSNSS